MMNCGVLVTGGAGFIGSNFVRTWLAQHQETIINVDKLTYAGSRFTLEDVAHHPQHIFVEGDINDASCMNGLLQQYQPRAIIHFAAETHVDRAIHSPADFMQANIMGTFHLLESARHYWQTLTAANHDKFRFIHISTDEVYGSLLPHTPAFTELDAYQPNNPYSAAKASADHLVRAWFHTYGLPIVMAHCSNNYGPYQHPEKLIPKMILCALAGKSLPVYGDGLHIRDWLYVEDHCTAIHRVLRDGIVGEKYHIGGRVEKTNKEVIYTVCRMLDALAPKADGASYQHQVAFVEDRAGHDRRYAMDTNKIKTQLGWQPLEGFESGMRKTIQWYLGHAEWIRQCLG